MRWAWLALCLCACGSRPAAERSLLTVSVAAQVTAAQITRVSVQVAPAGVSADLARDPAGTFSGTLAVPVGPQTVTATAWAGPTAAGSASAAVTVVKGQTAHLSITVLDATGAPPQPDHSPVITSLAASASAAAVGDPISLSAIAIDSDGDAISYSWTAAPASCGSFSPSASASTTFTAAAAGNCVVTVTARARGLSDSRSTTIVISGGGGAPAVPSLVQHLSSNSNEVNSGTRDGSSSTGRNHFRFTLPNPTLPGNTLILGVTLQPDPGAAISVTGITDSSGDAWSTTPRVTAGNGTSTPVQAVFVLANATAATHTVTVHTSVSPAVFQYTVSEFAGTDGTSAGTSSNVRNGGGSINAGTFTPANNDAGGGNLIWALFSQTGDAFQVPPDDWVPGGGFTLLDADIASSRTTSMDAHASMYLVQTASASVTPAMTLTAGGPQNYMGVAVALRAAATGTTPPAAGIHVNRILHTTNATPPATWKFKVPGSGNLIVMAPNEPNVVTISSITDNKGNLWSSYAPAGDTPQFWYAANAITGPDLMVTVNRAGSQVNTTVLWYDISGAAAAAPVDGRQFVSGQGVDCTVPANTCPTTTISDFPALTPVSPGLTIASCSFGTGPSDGFAAGAPAGAVWDYVWYTGITDASRMDNADCRAHYYNNDLSIQHWNYHVDWEYYASPNTSSTAAAAAIHIRAE